MKPWDCSLVSEGGAHSAADEDKHPNEANDPNNKGDIEVVCHSPRHGSGGCKERATADSVILCYQKSTDYTEDNELEQAGEESAVNGADSPSVSPGSDEHEKRVKADNTVNNAHECCDQSQLRACLLAVDVTVIDQFYKILEEVLVQVLITHTDVSGD